MKPRRHIGRSTRICFSRLIGVSTRTAQRHPRKMGTYRSSDLASAKGRPSGRPFLSKECLTVPCPHFELTFRRSDCIASSRACINLTFGSTIESAARTMTRVPSFIICLQHSPNSENTQSCFGILRRRVSGVSCELGNFGRNASRLIIRGS